MTPTCGKWKSLCTVDADQICYYSAELGTSYAQRLPYRVRTLVDNAALGDRTVPGNIDR
jgi:hypothetical protein